jgi:hypothetical protein
MQVSKIVFVVLVVSQAFLTFVSAKVEVFKVKTEWETRVASASCIINTDDFGDKNIPLVAGAFTDLGLFSAFANTDVEGGQGLFNGEFDGSVDKELGEIIKFAKFDNGRIIGFAGDWVSTSTGALLTVTINGVTTITFEEFLNDNDQGSGFLGLVVEAGIDALEFSTVNNDGNESFQLDNARTAGQCVEEIRPDFKAENQISSADAVTFVTDGLASAVAFNNNAGTIISSKFAEIFAAFGGV